jgi:hypothetical protein
MSDQVYTVAVNIPSYQLFNLGNVIEILKEKYNLPNVDRKKIRIIDINEKDKTQIIKFVIDK